MEDCDFEIIKNLSKTENLKTEYLEKRLKVRKTNQLKLLYLENLAKENSVKKVKIKKFLFMILIYSKKIDFGISNIRGLSF